eukprot:Rmarinus@m.13229
MGTDLPEAVKEHPPRPHTVADTRTTSPSANVWRPLTPGVPARPPPSSKAPPWARKAKVPPLWTENMLSISKTNQWVRSPKKSSPSHATVQLPSLNPRSTASELPIAESAMGVVPVPHDKGGVPCYDSVAEDTRSRMLHAENEVVTIARELMEARKQIKLANLHKESHDKIVAEHTMQNTELRRQNEALSKELSQLRSVNETLQDELKRQHDQWKGDVNSHRQKISTAVAESQQVVVDYTDRLRRLNEETEDYKAQLMLADSRIEQLSIELRRIQHEDRQLREESDARVDLMQNLVDGARRKEQEATSLAARAELRCQELQNIIYDKEKEVYDLNKKLSALAQAKEESSWQFDRASKLQESLTATESALAQAREHSVALKAELDDTKEAFEVQRATFERELEEINKRFDDTRSSYEDQINKRTLEVSSLEKSLDEIQTTHDEFLETTKKKHAKLMGTIGQQAVEVTAVRKLLARYQLASELCPTCTNCKQCLNVELTSFLATDLSAKLNSELAQDYKQLCEDLDAERERGDIMRDRLFESEKKVESLVDDLSGAQQARETAEQTSSSLKAKLLECRDTLHKERQEFNKQFHKIVESSRTRVAKLEARCRALKQTHRHSLTKRSARALPAAANSGNGLDAFVSNISGSLEPGATYSLAEASQPPYHETIPEEGEAPGLPQAATSRLASEECKAEGKGGGEGEGEGEAAVLRHPATSRLVAEELDSLAQTHGGLDGDVTSAGVSRPGSAKSVASQSSCASTVVRTCEGILTLSASDVAHLRRQLTMEKRSTALLQASRNDAYKRLEETNKCMKEINKHLSEAVIARESLQSQVSLLSRENEALRSQVQEYEERKAGLEKMQASVSSAALQNRARQAEADQLRRELEARVWTTKELERQLTYMREHAAKVTDARKVEFEEKDATIRSLRDQLNYLRKDLGDGTMQLKDELQSLRIQIQNQRADAMRPLSAASKTLRSLQSGRSKHSARSWNSSRPGSAAALPRPTSGAPASRPASASATAATPSPVAGNVNVIPTVALASNAQAQVPVTSKSSSAIVKDSTVLNLFTDAVVNEVLCSALCAVSEGHRPVMVAQSQPSPPNQGGGCGVCDATVRLLKVCIQALDPDLPDEDIPDTTEGLVHLLTDKTTLAIAAAEEARNDANQMVEAMQSSSASRIRELERDLDWASTRLEELEGVKRKAETNSRESRAEASQSLHRVKELELTITKKEMEWSEKAVEYQNQVAVLQKDVEDAKHALEESSLENEKLSVEIEELRDCRQQAEESQRELDSAHLEIDSLREQVKEFSNVSGDTLKGLTEAAPLCRALAEGYIVRGSVLRMLSQLLTQYRYIRRYHKGVDKHPFSEEKLIEYGKYLKLDLTKERELVWFADEAHDAPVPQGWSEHTDDSGNVYYHNSATNASQFDHPLDRHFLTTASLLRCEAECRDRVKDLRMMWPQEIRLWPTKEQLQAMRGDNGS